MEQSWLKIIDNLIVENGGKQDGYYTATITTTDVLTRADAVITLPNHRNVCRIVNMHYPKSSVEPIGINGTGGWKLYMKVRSK